MCACAYVRDRDEDRKRQTDKQIDRQRHVKVAFSCIKYSKKITKKGGKS